MSSASSAGASASSSSSGSGIADTVRSNALRFTISAEEYALLHQYLISRTPVMSSRAPKPRKEAKIVDEHDYNAATVRVAARLFVSTYSGLKLWEVISKHLSTRGAVQIKNKSVLSSPSFRLSLSLSTILFFHRLLHRFFTRLRNALHSDDAKGFRRRNPLISKALTSSLAPAVASSLAGFALGLSPADQTRVTITIYALTRGLEFLYNSLEEQGYLRRKPWWWGAWMLAPLTFGQLLHASVFDRDCFPASYGSFIYKRSPAYIQNRPTDRPANLPWPSTFEIVDGLADVARLKWPAFISPILFPSATKTRPTMSLSKVAPLTDLAHPAIKRLSCAILHPQDPSCFRTFLSYYSQAFPSIAKFFTLVYTVFALARYRDFISYPLTTVNSLAARILRTSFFLTSAIGTAWASNCIFQRLLPASVLPTGRYFFGGFLAGMWAFVDRRAGRSSFLYSLRLSLDSLWKVGKKRDWWRGVKGGDVLLFVVSLALMNVVYEKQPSAVKGAMVRKTMGMLRGDGWVDRAAVLKSKEPGEDIAEDVEERRDQ